MRKTTYRELYQFVVPIEISMERVLIMSNSTMNETLILSTNCGGVNADLRTESWTILKIPSCCGVKSKNLDIASREKSDSVSGTVELEMISRIEYKKLATKQKSKKQIDVTLSSSDTADSDSKEFKENDDSTMKELNSIDLKHEGILEEFRAVKIGGLSSTICIVIMIVAILLVMARNKCKSKKTGMNGVNVNVNLERNDDNVSMPENDPQMNIQQNSIANENETLNKSINQFK